MYLQNRKYVYIWVCVFACVCVCGYIMHTQTHTYIYNLISLLFRSLLCNYQFQPVNDAATYIFNCIINEVLKHSNHIWHILDVKISQEMPLRRKKKVPAGREIHFVVSCRWCSCSTLAGMMHPTPTCIVFSYS